MKKLLLGAAVLAAVIGYNAPAQAASENSRYSGPARGPAGSTTTTEVAGYCPPLNDGNPFTGRSRFVSKNGQWQWTGISGGEGSEVSLEIVCNGLPAYTTNTWKFNIIEQGDADPQVQTVWTNNGLSYILDPSLQGLYYGINQNKSGVYTFSFSGKDYGLPSGSKLSKVAVYDGKYNGFEDYKDQIFNVTIDGNASQPMFRQGQGSNPVFMCY